jgi:restriction system protein
VNIRSKAKSALTTFTNSSNTFAQLSANKTSALTKGVNTSTIALSVKDWVISLFIKAISTCSAEQDRVDAVLWLALSREILSNDSLSSATKTKKIFALTDSRRIAMNVLRGVGEAFKNYKKSDMPLAVKIAIPVTLSAGAILGGPSVGIAGFGSAVGVPVLLVIFLGVAGITSVLETVISGSEDKSYLAVIAYMIANDEVLRRANQGLRKAMSEETAAPRRCDSAGAFSEDVRSLFAVMDPFDFEKHVMSYFQDAGLMAWVTKKSNDAGVDGFARHANGLIVVQCKRNSESNNVGRPIVQQFKGVVEENSAWRGFIVTTSSYTRDAIDSASKNENIVLIGIEELVEWHQNGIDEAKYLSQD